MRANYQVNATPQFRVLSDEQIEENFYSALDVLERVGARLYGEEALALVREAGCLVSQEQGSSAAVSALVRIPPWLVKTALASAPQRIVIAGRDRSKRMHLEKDKIYFGTGSDCPSLVDPYSDELRKWRQRLSEEQLKVSPPEDGQGGCAETVRPIRLFEAPDPKAPQIGTAGICYSVSYVLRIDAVRGRKAEFKDQDFWCIGYQNEICNPRWYDQKNGYIVIRASGHWAWVRTREIADYLIAQTWAQEFAEADSSQLMDCEGYQVHEKPSAASKRLLTLQEGKHLIRRFTGRQAGSWLGAEVWELPEEGGGEYLDSYELDRLPIFRTSVKHSGWIKVLTDRGEPGQLSINYSGM